MEHKTGIVVVGSIIYDFRIMADTLPRPGETVTGYGFGTSTGGKGANQAVAAARLGADVCLIGRIGQDVFGDQVIRQFDTDGVNHEFVIRDSVEPTATCLIHVDKQGENAIIIAVGANGRVSCADVEASRNRIEYACVLLLQNEVPLAASLHALSIANQKGVAVVFNPAPAKPLPDEALRNITYFTPNETEACFYSGIAIDGNLMCAKNAAAHLISKGIRHVVITLGSQGALYAESETCRLYPAFKITPVDTTAAGDAFNGGLAVMISEGRPIPEAIRFANAAGAVCSRYPGAQTAIGRRQEVEELIKQQGTPDHLRGIAI